ncbi:MAG TPA: nucleotide sugar dehydrogenase, partial [Ilumatobacteraceae bacterium]|nr:nucleotide sugar dehydrogenase [Ilumatobacteraceae bacterium]
APHIRPDCTIVLESTTYPGTTTELFTPLLESGSGLRAGADFHVGYSPERIDPGNEKHTLLNTPKVVSGIDAASLAKVDEFFSSIVETTVPVQSTAQAELVKLLENTFRHVNIALVNELAIFAHQLGVDIWQTIDAATTKPFGYMRFTPGPGVGGHCLPVDPSYLAWEVKRRTGQTFRFIELANDVNAAMPHYVVERADALLRRHGKTIEGANVLLLGLAYKKATSDWRESPSIHVADRLNTVGAHVTFCDPYIPPVNTGALTYPMIDYSAAAMADADLVILLVDHPEFDPAEVAASSAIVLDTKGVLRGHRLIGEVL